MTPTGHGTRTGTECSRQEASSTRCDVLQSPRAPRARRSFISLVGFAGSLSSGGQRVSCLSSQHSHPRWGFV